MATEVLMPKLGLTMTEGTIEEWKYKEGDAVKKGDILFSVATDKLTNDVECEEDGTLLKILLPEGVTALAVCGILLSVALIDAETQLIPDRLNLALAVCGVLGTLLSPAGWLPHLIGAFCVSVPMLLLCLVIDGAFGGGDIKLMAAAGLFLGWQNTLLAMFLGILGGGLYGIWLLPPKGPTKGTTLPSARFYVRAS